MKMLKHINHQPLLRRLLTVFLAGCLMLTSVACSGSKAGAPEVSNPSTVGQGMYPHEDNERDTPAVDAKVDRAVREAEQRRQKVLNPEDDYLEETQPTETLKNQVETLSESAQEVSEDAKDAAQQAVKNAGENTQDSLENLKGATEKAVDQAADAVEQAT